MASLSKVNTLIVLVTICVINIFNTSAIQTIDGKYSLDSHIDPVINKEECDSYYTGNNKLCDMNKFLTYPMKQKVGKMMEKAKNLPVISCPFKTDGIEFGVFIMSSFNDYHSIKMNENYDVQEASKFYAKLFHEKWEIGNEECNNGILIFLNVNDRFIYISTSTYLKMNYISDQWINDNLLPSIRPYLKDGEYGEAIINLIESITDKCQQVTVDKMVESEQKLKKNKNINDNVNSQNDIHHNHNNHHHYQNHEAGDSFWSAMIVIFLLSICLWWLWQISCCSCCDDEEYNDEGRPSRPIQPQREPGAYPQAQPGMIRNRRNAARNVRNVENVNVYNHYHQYPKQQFSATTTIHTNKRDNGIKKKKTKTAQGGGAGMSFADNNSDRLGEERKRKQKEEKERKERKLKEENSKLVDNGKRTDNEDGGGMSWENTNNTFSSSEKEKREKEKKLKEQNQKRMDNAKRTRNGGGGGMNWGNSVSSSSSSTKSSPKFKRTDENAGAGGSW